MDVLSVKQYLETKKERAKLESGLKRLQSELAEVQARETELYSKVNPDSLITARSVKAINQFLSNRPLWFNDFPVDFVNVTLARGGVHLSIIFSQPLFRGWRTETPYRSYQCCKVSLETPAPPDENHIPEYLRVSDQDMDVICWEREGNVLKLWSDEQHVAKFRWGDSLVGVE